MLHRVLGYVKTQTTVRLSKMESASSAAMTGFTDQYLVPFAVAMRATDMQVGLISSIPNLVAAVAVTGVPPLVRKLGSRKAVLLSVVFLHAAIWLVACVTFASGPTVTKSVVPSGFCSAPPFTAWKMPSLEP